jgi:hypothetical protein
MLGSTTRRKAGELGLDEAVVNDPLLQFSLLAATSLRNPWAKRRYLLVPKN